MKSRFFSTIVAAFLALGGIASAAQVDSTKYLCSNQGPIYGETNSVCVDTSQNGLVGVGNGDPVIALNRFLWNDAFIDFIGPADPPREGDTLVNNLSPFWLEDDSAAGAPTLAVVADFDSGAFEMTLASNSEAEYVSLSFNDELNIDTDNGPIMYARVRVDVMPAAAAESIVIGFASARNDTLNSITNNAWFYINTDSDLLVESDDNTTDDDDNDTTVDVVADDWYEYKVDCSVPTDCDFFYRTTLGGDWTEVLADTAFSIGADAAVQPFVRLEKTSGTGVPSIDVDYILAMWRRVDE